MVSNDFTIDSNYDNNHGTHDQWFLSTLHGVPKCVSNNFSLSMVLMNNDNWHFTRNFHTTKITKASDSSIFCTKVVTFLEGCGCSTPSSRRDSLWKPCKVWIIEMKTVEIFNDVHWFWFDVEKVMNIIDGSSELEVERPTKCSQKNIYIYMEREVGRVRREDQRTD